jgi:S1-C subfamily serine protease
MKRIFLLGSLAIVLLCAGTAVFSPLELPSSATAQTLSPKLTDAAEVADQLGSHFEAIASKVSPAVVAVEAVKPAPANDSKKRTSLEESGSGVIIRMPEQQFFLVLTNNHVVAGAKVEQITVQLSDGRVFRPGKVWADAESDIALLRLDGTVNLPTAVLGDSDRIRVGHWVLAIGSPFGLNQTVTHGIISARERGQVSLGSTIRIKNFLQTDAPINPGSSGGPLVDMRGEVVGINTAIASNNGINSGVAFSIPVNLVKRIMQQLLGSGTVARGYLGLQVAQTFTPQEAMKLGLDRVRGALVEQVFPGTPAESAGLRVNDVILQVENLAIRDENQLINLISSLPAGQRIRMQVWRDRRVATYEAIVGDWQEAQNRFRAER